MGQSFAKTSFRIIGYLEAISVVALFGFAMPMKYLYEVETATRIPGTIHGTLFILYIILTHILADKENWPQKKIFAAYVASVVPLGTLVFDRKYLRD